MRAVSLNGFDEAYETSEFEEEDGGAGKNKTKVGVADKEVLKRLDKSFKKLMWARGTQSLLKRFLTKRVSSYSIFCSGCIASICRREVMA